MSTSSSGSSSLSQPIPVPPSDVQALPRSRSGCHLSCFSHGYRHLRPACPLCRPGTNNTNLQHPPLLHTGKGINGSDSMRLTFQEKISPNVTQLFTSPEVSLIDPSGVPSWGQFSPHISWGHFWLSLWQGGVTIIRERMVCSAQNVNSAEVNKP